MSEVAAFQCNLSVHAAFTVHVATEVRLHGYQPTAHCRQHDLSTGVLCLKLLRGGGPLSVYTVCTGTSAYGCGFKTFNVTCHTLDRQLSTIKRIQTPAIVSRRLMPETKAKKIGLKHFPTLFSCQNRSHAVQKRIFCLQPCEHACRMYMLMYVVSESITTPMPWALLHCCVM